MKQRCLLFALVFLCAGHLFSQNRKYFSKNLDTAHIVIYVSDPATEQAFSGETTQETTARFKAIPGIMDFTRTGNGYFRLVTAPGMLNDILLHYFHFTEKEIAHTAKAEEDAFNHF